MMPAGRPTAYKPEYVEQARKLCEFGATDFEIAQFFEVDVSTIYRWKNTHPEFCEAIKTGKEVADERVERSLYAKANGYSYNSEKIFNNNGEILRAATIEHVPPSDTAAIFWLKNRRKDLWRDKHETGFTDADGNDVSFQVQFVSTKSGNEPASDTDNPGKTQPDGE